MEERPVKVSLIRHIIMKLFCLHDYKEEHTIYVKDLKADTVGKKTSYLCTKCGKDKVINL